MGRVTVPLSFLISFLSALIAGFLLFNDAVSGELISIIVEIGLDPLRAQLIAALTMVAGTALISAVLGRHRLGSLLGTAVVFCFGYLVSFLQLELQPVRDPAGILEAFHPAALFYTLCIMMALAGVSAFIGSAVGIALGEVLFDPLYWLGRAVVSHANHLNRIWLHSHQWYTLLLKEARFYRYFGAITMVLLLVLVSGSGNLFIFSPDIGIYTVNRSVVRGTVIENSIVSRALHGLKKSFFVYLPPSYKTLDGGTHRYPALYLLHGSPGRGIDWFAGGEADQSADALIALHKIPELIMILPDGNGRSKYSSEWADSFDRSQLMETYVVTDLVRYVDQHYRTIADPADRAIGGLSTGAFGAMNIIIHHPTLFSSVISLGGYYHADSKSWVWGHNAAYIQKNSPDTTMLHQQHAERLHIYLGAAKKDQPYYNDTKRFARELDTLHIPYRFDLQAGYHSYVVWRTQLYNALIWLHWGK